MQNRISVSLPTATEGMARTEACFVDTGVETGDFDSRGGFISLPVVGACHHVPELFCTSDATFFNSL